MSSPNGSGFILSNADPTTLGICTKYTGDLNSYSVTFQIHMNDTLSRTVTNYEIYLSDGDLFGYGDIAHQNLMKLKPKKISPKLMGETLTFKFGYYLPQSKDDQLKLKRSMFHTVYETTITLSEPKQYETEICAICTDPVIDVKTKYVSPCGHLLHLNCLFDYLRSAGKLYEIPPRCVNRCCNSPKIKPFNCPCCRRLIS